MCLANKKRRRRLHKLEKILNFNHAQIQSIQPSEKKKKKFLLILKTFIEKQKFKSFHYNRHPKLIKSDYFFLKFS